MMFAGQVTDQNSVLAHIYDLMREVAPQSTQHDPNLSFLEAGIDSMKIMLLLTRLEDAFEFEFESAHLAPQCLGSPAALVALLLDHYLTA